MDRIKGSLQRDIYLTLPALSVYAILRIVYGRLDLWLSPGSSLLLFDRLFYGISFVLPAMLMFLYILPRMIRLSAEEPAADPFIAPHIIRKPDVRIVIEGLLTGILFFSIIYTAARLSGVNISGSDSGPEKILPSLISASILTPLFEEYFYRSIFIGYFLIHGGSPFASIAVSALAFGAAHNPVAAPLLFLFGVALGILSVRNGIFSPIIAHSIYNGLILYFS